MLLGMQVRAPDFSISLCMFDLVWHKDLCMFGCNVAQRGHMTTDSHTISSIVKANISPTKHWKQVGKNTTNYFLLRWRSFMVPGTNGTASLIDVGSDFFLACLGFLFLSFLFWGVVYHCLPRFSSSFLFILGSGILLPA